MKNRKISEKREVIAVIPCAGKATRLPSLTCSKELYPIGFYQNLENGKTIPKPVSLNLLEKFRAVGIKKVYLVLRKGKWDIPEYFGSGNSIGMDLGYLIMGSPYGTAYTINQAYPFVNHANVAIGFPDILYADNSSVNSPDNVFSRLLNTLEVKDADIVLGIFPADKSEKVDMVELDVNNNVQNIVIKPRQTNLKYTWGLAVWTPVFTQFLHDYLHNLKRNESDTELFIGNVIQIAISKGLKVIAENVSNSPFLDIGTPEDLQRAETQFGQKMRSD